jgi:ribonuclease-3 family protein
MSGKEPEAWPAGRRGAGEIAGTGTAGTEVWPVEPPARPPRLMSPIALAYVGDAVFELLVRQHLAARPNHKPDELHRGAVRFVSAKAQRALLEKLQPHLTEEEAEVVRRGRNAKSGSPPKGADMSDYRHATALECLFGWLYYAGRYGRMAELLRMADDDAPAAGADAAVHRKEGDR